MLDVRTAPPPAPVAPDPKEVTPETGELSSVKVDATSDSANPDMPGDHPQPGAPLIIPMRASPTESSDDSATAIVESSQSLRKTRIRTISPSWTGMRLQTATIKHVQKYIKRPRNFAKHRTKPCASPRG